MTGAPASAAGGAGPRRAPGAGAAAAAGGQAGLWNVANLLTMARLLLVPAFVLLMLQDGGYDPAWRAWAWAAFAIAMITDVFDGHLARTYNLVTDFGKIADPIADKAIMGAALICLSALGDLPWWVTGVILLREIGITLLRLWVIRHGVIAASRGGKMKTLAQGIAVGMYVLALVGPLATLRFWVMAVAVALTVVTGLDYVRQAIVLRRRGLAAERAAAVEAAEPRESAVPTRDAARTEASGATAEPQAPGSGSDEAAAQDESAARTESASGSERSASSSAAESAK